LTSTPSVKVGLTHPSAASGEHKASAHGHHPTLLYVAAVGDVLPERDGVGLRSYPSPSPITPSPADFADLDFLAARFRSTADSVQSSIASRPMVGVHGSPFSLDFAPETLAERSLLSFAVPGALGLLQGARGNARGLALLYTHAGPPLVDPAPFELMRGIWEKALLASWLLDGGIPSRERVGRLKGWVEQGLTRDSHSRDRLPSDTQTLIREMLDECPEKPIRPPGFVDLSTRYQSGGENVYRKLSGLLHGRVWSVIPAFATAADEDGQVVAWRGYPLSLHRELAEPVANAAEWSMQTVNSYFSKVGQAHDPADDRDAPADC